MKINTPEAFYNTIPKSLPENVEFRKDLHVKLANDVGFQKTYIEMCRELPQVAFSSMFWTFNPKNPKSYRHMPFILRPSQYKVITEIHDSCSKQYDRVLDKSRDEGATDILMGYIALFFVIEPDFMALVGSRKADYVDKGVEIFNDKVSGDHKSLFYKICYKLQSSPGWFRKDSPLRKTYMHLENLENGSLITGEATNENFGAGDRRAIIVLDEFGRVDYNLAQCILESINDVSDCVIYNSTHFYGTAHPYNKILTSGKTKISILAWEENPTKNPGMYRSPDLDMIEIRDIEFYRNLCPKTFAMIQPKELFKLSELKRRVAEVHPDEGSSLSLIDFVADGGTSNDGGWRSEWYDRECKRRHSRRDIAQNIDRNPVGSGDMFFTPVTLRRIRLEYIREPDYAGEMVVKKDINSKITSVIFKQTSREGRLKWWGKLISGRPDQSHNYIVGNDISRGTGNSNSVCSIYDANSHEVVGEWICPNTPPEAFGDIVIGICKWVGGQSDPYLIWESTGPGGAFEKRVLFHSYNNYYIPVDERSRRRKRKDRRGWGSTRENKYDLLQDLDIALGAAVKGDTKHKRIVIHNEETLTELENYINYESGEIGPATAVKDSSGARKTHGDKVIPLGLIILAAKYQPVGVKKQQVRTNEKSLGYRLKQRQHQRSKEQSELRFSNEYNQRHQHIS